MSWKGQRSRISFRNLLRNRKTVIIAVLCCLVAVGAYAAYVGLHKPTSQAGELEPYKGALSYTTDNGKPSGKITSYSVPDFSEKARNEAKGLELPKREISLEGKTGDRTNMGTPENPFMILEIVPWKYYSEMSYMTDGTEAFDIYTIHGAWDKDKAKYYNDLGKNDPDILTKYDSYRGQTLKGFGHGAAVTKCFAEEDYPGKGAKEGDWDYKYQWKKDSGTNKVKGYYECVSGLGSKYTNKARFYISGVEDGRPVFSDVSALSEEERAEVKLFIWVSLGDDVSSDYKFYVGRENKNFEAGATKEDMNAAYKAGDREYTTRTGETYSMPNVDPSNSPQKAKAIWVHDNGFLRYSLRLRTMEEVDNYCIIVKVAEAEELNEHPEWIDYADFMYMHLKDEGGSYNSMVKGIYLPSHEFSSNSTTSKQGASFLDKEYDFTWEVAEKLYMKANCLAKYVYDENGKIKKDKDGNAITEFDYTGYGKYAYAPIIIAKTIIDALNSGEKHKDPTYYMNYMNMKPQKKMVSGTGNVRTENSGLNNNFYKFCLMDLLMDQDMFYDLFYQPLDSTGKPVIQTVEINGVKTGVHSTQEGDAQYYWCPTAFLPYDEQVVTSQQWGGERGTALRDKYGINWMQAFMNFEGSAILNYTFIYNSNSTIFQYGTGTNITEDAQHTQGAFDWFRDEYDEDYQEGMTSLEIIHFLLNYKKGLRSREEDRQEIKLRVLDVEPCSDYTYLTATALRALFPASRYKLSFKITHMTTAELNGNRDNLMANYDIIYVGTGDGKFNLSSSDDTVHNDNALDNKVYVHVGDTVEGSSKEYRTSGDDLTSVKRKEIVEFAKEGKIVLLDTPVYNDSQRLISRESNISKMSTTIKGRKNVVSLEDLLVTDVIDENSFMIGRAEVKMLSTPATYQNAMADESGSNAVAAIEKVDGKYRLNFVFTIGYKAAADETYAAKFLIDRNGDGIISEDEAGADIVDTWSESGSGTIYVPGSDETPLLDENGDEKIDEETGEVITKETPKQYTASYIIPEDYENGAIAWKFILYATNNKAICYEWSGVSRYTGFAGKSSTSIEIEDKDDNNKKKKLIRILQVTDDGASAQANLESELEKSGLFGKYAKLEDYKFQIKTISLSDYVKAFADANDSSSKYKNCIFSVKAGDKKTDYYYPGDYIYNYDLYLFSCGKELEKADNSKGAVSFASWLVDQGYPVVFTKDSIYSYSKNTGAVDALKDSTGVSRFTASSDYAKQFVDTPYNQKGEKYTSHIKDMEFTYYNAFINATGADKYKTYRNNKWYKANGKEELAELGSKDGLNTTEGTQTNLGTVCVYPYTIDDDIDLTSTGAQDYQLNLENPYAAVWYCLGRTNADGKNNSYYTISPNDASNNYYLYSVNNIFYCGIDLNKIPDKNVQEMQLFINTLIAASEASYVEPYVTVNSVYNRETKKNEVGPSKRGSTETGLDYMWSNAANASNQIDLDAVKKAGVRNFYRSMITVGESGKNFRYKLYQVPKDPDADDTILWNGANFEEADAGTTGTNSTDNLASAGQEVNKATDLVSKHVFYDGDVNGDWSGTAKISADDLNKMSLTDELRIFYYCDDKIMENNTVTVNGKTSQYEMTKDDRLLEIGIVLDEWNTVYDYIRPYMKKDADYNDVDYADDVLTTGHEIIFTKGQLEDYVEKVLAKNNVTNVKKDADGNLIFYDMIIKKSEGEQYNPAKKWGKQEYWGNGGYTYKNAENPVKLEMLAIFGEDEDAVNRKSAKSTVTTITEGNLYPASADGKIKGDTHRIYFTPYAGTDNDDDVVALEIFFVRVDENGNLFRTRIVEEKEVDKKDNKGKVVGKEKVTTITPQVFAEVYREDGDKKYTKIANVDGIYSIENGGTLKSSREYFLTYDKKKANMEGYKFIEFEIFNDKKSSKTVLELEPNANPKSEDVYLFNLD